MAADDQSDKSFARPRGPLHLQVVPPRPGTSALADAVIALVPAVQQLDRDVCSLLDQSVALDVLHRRTLGTLDRHEGILEEHRKLLDRYASVVARLEQRLTKDAKEFREKLDSQHDDLTEAARQGAREAIEEHTQPGIGPSPLFEQEERVSRTPSDPAVAAKKVGLGVLILLAQGAWKVVRFAWKGVGHILMPILGMAIVAWAVNFAYQHHWIKAPPEKVLAPAKAAE